MRPVSRLPSPEVKVMLWGLIWGSEALLIVREHLHLKFTQREVRFDWQHDGGWVGWGSNIHRSGAEMDG